MDDQRSEVESSKEGVKGQSVQTGDAFLDTEDQPEHAPKATEMMIMFLKYQI